MCVAMVSVAAANATTFVLTALLIGVVLVRRPASRPVHGQLLLLLAGLLVWSGGAVWRAIAPDHEQIMAAHHLIFLGVNAAPVVWLLLASSATRLRWFEARPHRRVAVVVPGILLYLAFVTNSAHGWFAHIEYETFERGPLFWVMVAWAFACSLGGTGIFLHRARSMARGDERRGALLLALAAVIPLVVAATYLFRWLPWPIDPTPGSLGFSAALLYPIVLRLRALEDLPLLRRDVIDHLQDAVMIADPGGIVVDHNRAARALLPDAGPLRGRPLAELIALLCSDREAASIGSLLAAEEPVHADLDGRGGRTFRLQSARVTGEAGWSAGCFVVLHDRSEERRAERALRQAQKLESIGMLASGIAHEVNNPLAYIRANLGHLAEGAAIASRLARKGDVAGADTLTEMPEVLEETLQGIDRITRIVSGLKRLSREGADDHEALDVTGLIDEAVRLAVLSRTRGDARIEVHAPALPPVRGSRDGLVQALLNLLLNARQAVGDRPDGRVRVTARTERAGVRIEVEDDGPGVAPDLVERIFDPFFTTRSPGEGTGLGLSIAFDLVREHRGTLEVGASALGGARFSIWLPRA